MKIKNSFKLLFRKSSVETPIPKEDVFKLTKGNGSSQNSTVPHFIWTYWHDEEIRSSITQLCLDRIKFLNPSFTLRIVNKNTLKTWLPDFPIVDQDLPIANISDLIRLMLLERYGGIYLDASILLFEPLDWLLDIQKTNKADTVAYYSAYNTINPEYPMVETWCLAAIPRAPFIQCWLDEYKKCILSNDPDTYYANDAIVPKTEAVLGYEYYKCYYAGQVVLRRDVELFRLALMEADHDAFLYGLQTPNPWSDLHFANIMMINKAPQKLPKMAKIINTSRKRMDKWIAEGYWKKDSIYGLIRSKVGNL